MKRTIATAGAAWLAATVLTQASAVAAPASGAAAARQTHRPPNIVVILVDDLGWPDVSVYGRKTVPTPNLERLARDGVAYTNGYVAASVCAVSRAALLTGRMPQRYGFQYNLDDSANHDQGLPLDQATLADRLKAQGYRTAAIGKWHQGYTPAYYPTKRGFDSFYGFLAGETLYADPGTAGIVTTPIRRDKSYARKDGWNTVTGTDGHPVANHSRYLTDDFTDQAAALIGRSANERKPFFLYLAYNAPHWPLQVPQAWYDRFATIKDPVRRTFVAMIAAMDAGVGRVLDTLETKGVRNDTLVVFLSDNGCPIQFGFCDCSHPLGAGKFSYLEGGTRVPFIVSWGPQACTAAASSTCPCPHSTSCPPCYTQRHRGRSSLRNWTAATCSGRSHHERCCGGRHRCGPRAKADGSSGSRRIGRRRNSTIWSMIRASWSTGRRPSPT